MADTRVGTSPARLYLHLNDQAWKGIDFGPLLRSGAALSGTPTITISPSSGLVAASVQVNSTTFADADPAVTSIAANEGVIAKFDPSTAGTYDVIAECDTDDDQHLAVTVEMVVKS